MIKLGKYEICLIDLLVDKEGKLSSTQVWYHIANIIESYRILYNNSVDSFEVLFYLVIVGGSKLAMQVIKLKFGEVNGNKTDGLDIKE